jgi:ribosomal protein S16
LYKKLTIKLFKVRAHSPNVQIKVIVIGYNNKPNGAYVERLGVFYKEHGVDFVLLNMPRFSYWVYKGVKIKPKVSWALGMLGQAEACENEFDDKL